MKRGYISDAWFYQHIIAFPLLVGHLSLLALEGILMFCDLPSYPDCGTHSDGIHGQIVSAEKKQKPYRVLQFLGIKSRTLSRKMLGFKKF